MPRCVVVADDLTGANATGVLLKKNGFDTLTLLRPAMDKASSLSRCDCLVLPTDSRAIPGEEAYARVREALELLAGPEVLHYAKRIDSTLRGNLGRETDAFLDFLGPAYMAVCVPCFPSSGRVLVGGHLLVGGRPLRKTEAASDPKCPICTSDALALMRGQSTYPVASIHLDDVQDGAEHLAEVMSREREKGTRILLVDSVSEEDMLIVADAIVKAGIPVVSVDPGPFTAIMGKKLLPKEAKRAEAKVLCTIGSVNAVAATQTIRLLSQMNVAAVFLDAARLLESPEKREEEIERLTRELLAIADTSDVLAVIGSGIDPENRIDFHLYTERWGVDVEGLSQLINTAFARIALDVMAQCPQIKGVYSTGGDITAAIHTAAGTVGLRLLDEVVPLAGYGIAMGGTLAGKAFISKGGMVGDEQAMITCVSYLQQHIN